MAHHETQTSSSNTIWVYSCFLIKFLPLLSMFLHKLFFFISLKFIQCKLKCHGWTVCPIWTWQAKLPYHRRKKCLPILQYHQVLVAHWLGIRTHGSLIFCAGARIGTILARSWNFKCSFCAFLIAIPF